MEILLHIPEKYTFFNSYRGTTHRGRYGLFILAKRSDTQTALYLNDTLPKNDENALEIEENTVGKIEDFSFTVPASLERFRGNFRKTAALLAQRAAYYLEAPTIKQKYSIKGFMEKVIEIERWIKNAIETLYIDIADRFSLDAHIMDIWGRKGIEVGVKTGSNRSFGQWFSVGFYYREKDHKIPLKIPNIPEMAVFFDVNNVKRKELLNDESFCALIEKLKDKGFENNINAKGNINLWRFLYKRKPFIALSEELTEIDGDLILTEFKNFFDTALEEIGEVGLNEHKYFKELFLKK
jgi:hypothetical protein